jgi:hypothetical protein
MPGKSRTIKLGMTQALNLAKLPFVMTDVIAGHHQFEQMVVGCMTVSAPHSAG